MSFENANVRGAVVALYIAAVDGQDLEPLLKQYGFTDINPNEWYSLSNLVALFEDMKNLDGSTSNFVSWGMKVGQLTVDQTAAEMDYEAFILQMNHTYHFFHEGENVGDIIGAKISDKEYTLTCSSPYHDDFEYGIYYRQAQILLGRENQRFTLKYNEEQPRRAQGGTTSIYRILLD